MDRKFHPLTRLNGAAGKTYLHGGKGDAPDSPDYAALAAAQAQADIKAAQVNSKLNNPNIVNPYGTQTVTYGGGAPTFDSQGYDAALKTYQTQLAAYNKAPTGGSIGAFGGMGLSGLGGAARPPAPVAPDKNSFYRTNGDPNIATVTQKLSPGEQAVYDKNLQSRQNIGDLGIAGSNALKNIIGTEVDYSGAPTVGDGSETRSRVYNALMGRVDEDTANSRDQRNSDLIAAGIRPGTKAYDDAQNLITRGYNDARGNAEINAGNAAAQQQGLDTTARNSYIAELLAKRQVPLNEINALMSGSQVNNPFSGGLGYQAGANTQGAQVMQAGQLQNQADMNRYNAQTAQNNQTMSTVGALGTAAVMMF